MKEKRKEWEGSEVVVEWNENGGRCKKLIWEKWDEKRRGGKKRIWWRYLLKKEDKKDEKGNGEREKGTKREWYRNITIIVRRRWKIQLEK